MEILKEAGIDPYEDEKGTRDTRLIDFCFAKCSKRDNVVFPNMLDIEGWSKEGQGDARYRNFIFGESVFLLPISYDPSNDAVDAIQKKKSFLDTMLDYAKQMGKSKAEQDKFVQDAEKNVNFGPSGYDWSNKYLKIIHDKLGQYYKNGKLRVWLPEDMDYDAWEGMDYPHKYDVVGNLNRPNGVYYLSDIEKYIGTYLETWLLYSQDKDIRQKAASGGTITGLLIYLLDCLHALWLNTAYLHN
jgi:hypothetical protein